MMVMYCHWDGDFAALECIYQMGWVFVCVYVHIVILESDFVIGALDTAHYGEEGAECS